MAHVCAPPALIEVTAPSAAGGVACPSLLEPQQAAVLSLRIAHLSLSPALISVTVAAPGGVCTPEVSRQQDVARSLPIVAQGWRSEVRPLRVPSPAGGVLCP